jgi:4-oxalmesaconate hydratase
VIVDVHGHYTTAPAGLGRYRDALRARYAAGVLRDLPVTPVISDDDIRASVAGNQLRVQQERGTDVTIFSPRASWMDHHVTDPVTAGAWARVSNDLVHRVCRMFPRNFAPACQLPQVPGGSLAPCVRELERCVTELGFVGCNLNPDPAGGLRSSPPLTDEYWFPLYEKLAELDVPAMIHVSASCNPAVHTLGAHYLNAGTTAFMQLASGSLFRRFPGLRFVIPHGGGAVPYHWGRFVGLATREGLPSLYDNVLGNVYFDTCVYHQPGMDLLTSVIPVANILFASEMLGAVRGANPQTGASWDDTRRYVDAARLSDGDRRQIYERNAFRVYPISRWLAASPA